MPRKSLADKHASELREMTDAHWTKRRMAASLGVNVATIYIAMKKLGIQHGGNRWTTRKFKTIPIIARLREERMGMSLSIDEFALKVGWHRSLISEWERGARRMHVPALVDVANALGYEVTLTRIGS